VIDRVTSTRSSPASTWNARPSFPVETIDRADVDRVIARTDL
jgi:hypothetical protein